MYISNSLERVRPLGPTGWGLPFVANYKKGELKPYFGTGEWDQTKDGRLWSLQGGFALPEYWTKEEIVLAFKRAAIEILASFFSPTPYGELGFGFFGSRQSPVATIGGVGSGANGTVALDSAYTYNSAGDAIGSRIVIPSTKTLDTVYAHVTSYTGTAANVNDLLIELRDNDAANIKPGSTLHDSISVDPASATGWIAFPGFTFSMVGGTPYWTVFADPDGNGTDFATATRNQGVTFSEMESYIRYSGSVTNGFSSGTVAFSANRVPVVVWKMSDSTVFGCPYTAVSTSSNTQNKKGLFVSDGFSESIKIFGIVFGSAATMGTPTVYEGGGTLPNDSTFAAFATALSHTTSIQGGMGPAVTFAKETPYSFVSNPTGNSTSPRKSQIGTGADATLRSAMLGGGNWYFREQGNSAANTWANDDTSSYPHCALLVEDQVEVATGGGSGGGQRVIGS